MPIFRLHLHNTHVDADDIEGHDLPDLAAAHAMALAGIRDFIGHEAMNETIDFRGKVDIEDEAGAVVQTVLSREAFTIKGFRSDRPPDAWRRPSPRRSQHHLGQQPWEVVDRC